MPEKINEAQLVKEDIVNRPDVTATIEAPEAVESGDNEPAKQSDKGHITYTPEKASRDARLLTRGTKKVFEELSDKKMASEHKEALEELGFEFFDLLRELNLPRSAHVSILLGLVALPFVPPLLKLIKRKPEPVEKPVEITEQGAFSGV